MPSSSQAQRFRLLLVVLVMLAVLHPIWTRIVNEAWDDLLGPRRSAAAPTPPGEPAAAATPSAAEPLAAPTAATAEVTPSKPPAVPSLPSEPTAAPARDDGATPEPTAPPPALGEPEVLGVSVGSGLPQVLVDLRGRSDASGERDAICAQAEAFVTSPLSGQRVRLQAHEGDAPTRDLGVVRCP